MGLWGPTMVTSRTGKGVIVMGGRSSGSASKAMFELTQSMEWTRLEQTLQIEHFGCLLAIPIPDELAYDKIKEKSIVKFLHLLSLYTPIWNLSPLANLLFFMNIAALLNLLISYFMQ